MGAARVQKRLKVLFPDECKGIDRIFETMFAMVAEIQDRAFDSHS
jgi:hypothetical protein